MRDLSLLFILTQIERLFCSIFKKIGSLDEKEKNVALSILYK